MANFKPYEQINVALTEHYYSINICRDGLHCVELLQTIVKSSQVFIVTNHTIAPLFLILIQSAFTDIQCDVIVLDDGEHFKNQQSLFTIYDALIEKQHHRDTTIIALGGGVIGDLAGFAASTYLRGVALVHIPTTLLAQIDASIGGKTAINHSQGKNLVGNFYQPQTVLIDIATLDTLPAREFAAGIGEMIKYALIAGGTLLYQLTTILEEGLTVNHPQLPLLIAQCCRIKVKFIEADEKEVGQRILLNLGHTFAHALEAYTHYQQWLHGEAVAIGLYCAVALSHEIGLVNKLFVEQVERMLHHAGLPHKIPSNINLKKLRDLMNLDKKIKNNCLRFILIKEPGNCYLDDTITDDSLYKALSTAVEGE